VLRDGERVGATVCSCCCYGCDPAGSGRSAAPPYEAAGTDFSQCKVDVKLPRYQYSVFRRYLRTQRLGKLSSCPTSSLLPMTSAAVPDRRTSATIGADPPQQQTSLRTSTADQSWWARIASVASNRLLPAYSLTFHRAQPNDPSRTRAKSWVEIRAPRTSTNEPRYPRDIIHAPLSTLRFPHSHPTHHGARRDAHPLDPVARRQRLCR
jgi:hypothetical protein